MTRFELEVFKKALCPHDDDYSYPCIVPEYLEQELEDIFLSLDEHTENEGMQMPVLAKVIAGLECCGKGVCYKCPYNDDPCQNLNADAVELIERQQIEIIECRSKIAELLKEQEAKWVEYPACLAYDGAYSDSHIVCSACEHVFDIMDNCTEEFDYCPHCGAKMGGQ